MVTIKGRLGDRIIMLLGEATEAAKAKPRPVGHGWMDTQKIAMSINEIARVLDVPTRAVNGALTKLHAQKRVIGMCYIAPGGRWTHYAVALA